MHKKDKKLIIIIIGSIIISCASLAILKSPAILFQIRKIRGFDSVTSFYQGVSWINNEDFVFVESTDYFEDARDVHAVYRIFIGNKDNPKRKLIKKIYFKGLSGDVIMKVIGDKEKRLFFSIKGAPVYPGSYYSYYYIMDINGNIIKKDVFDGDRYEQRISDIADDGKYILVENHGNYHLYDWYRDEIIALDTRFEFRPLIGKLNSEDFPGAMADDAEYVFYLNATEITKRKEIDYIKFRGLSGLWFLRVFGDENQYVFCLFVGDSRYPGINKHYCYIFDRDGNIVQKEGFKIGILVENIINVTNDGEYILISEWDSEEKKDKYYLHKWNHGKFVNLVEHENPLEADEKRYADYEHLAGVESMEYDALSHPDISPDGKKVVGIREKRVVVNDGFRGRSTTRQTIEIVDI